MKDRAEQFSIYIAGKITGDENYEKKFKKVENLIQSRGFEAVNPVELIKDFAYASAINIRFIKREVIMRECIDRLSRCDVICLLKDFSESAGATAEHYFAKSIGLPIIYDYNFITHSTESILEYLSYQYKVKEQSNG
ncbi:MAG: DUF4406 domain-containing protein [Elusimicrobiota bacterium]|jgi:nucleoside 2-deoxyribosyltransferase|nr:DUF4406 domain-containing protein [Elusimicrobiota bacterium]